MATNWEEIKKLAADFQRAQLSSSAQRLSEKNCVEIVQKIIQLKLLDVLFTSDGREYLTPEQLITEIKDELFIHGGRIDLTELTQILNVDFSHIESKANLLTSIDRHLHLILGQIINDDYLDHLAEEVNEKLQQDGKISINDLTKQYNLPGDFLQQVIDDRIGSIVYAQHDPFDRRMLFTPTFVAKHKARILGALSAATRPTQLSNIINQYKLQERLFYSILDDLLKCGHLLGTIQGPRQDKASFVPDMYSESLNNYIDSFFNQNNFLEYDSLIRLGINDPVGYIKKRYGNNDVTLLKSCCVNKEIINYVEMAIDDAIGLKSWIDIEPLLPSVLNKDDVNIFMQTIMKSKSKKLPDKSQVFCDSVLLSGPFIDECMESFDGLMIQKAREDIKNGVHLKLQHQAEGLLSSTKSEKLDDSKKDKKEERRKRAAGGKAGGGAQGRETKTKSVKKKFHRGGKTGDDSDSDDGEQSSRGSGRNVILQFMDPKEIEDELLKRGSLNNCRDDVCVELAEYLHRPLTKMYEKVALTSFQASASSSSISRKRAHDDIQEKLSAMYTNLKLFGKGILNFPDDVQAQLTKHLLKSTCTDIVNLIFTYVSTDHIQDITPDANITNEMRQKYILKLPDKLKDPLQKLHNSLTSKDTEDFFKHLDSVLASDFCNVVLKKIDKKRERQIIFNHRQSLSNQLNDVNDSALVLHICALLLYQTFSGDMLQASGKFVPHIMKYLEKLIPQDAMELLQEYQGLVIKSVKSKEPEEIQQCNERLNTLQDSVKEIAISLKKSSASKES